jgi:guanosine-3',5'-bis(diphosphate) 3'-pyrophosphohydrolase
MKANTEAPVGSRELLAALDFAARKHRKQRRNDAEDTPYINHPIRVATLLADVAGVEDSSTLQAALLHDTIEDTGPRPEELEEMFGPEVRQLVQEVTDDQSLPDEEQKHLQIEKAPELSPKARLVRLADKLANVSELTASVPADWANERKRAYVDWAEAMFGRLRGSNAALDQLFDRVALKKRRLFRGSSAPADVDSAARAART